jgi:pyruvate,orthophosphate dikinase
MTKWVYSFGAGLNEGRADMKNLLGGKGANLAEMVSVGLPVPPGFTITTEVCAAFYQSNRSYPPDLEHQVFAALEGVEQTVGRKFGDKKDPLLVSIRSGARVSMPGMMDTVLNLGLNDITVEGIAAAANDPRFAWDSYRRFIQMYGSVVLGIDYYLFEEITDRAKLAARGGWLQGFGSAGDRQAIPPGSDGTFVGRHRRGVRKLDEPSRDHISAAARHPGRLGHCGQRAGDGLRQHGR